jgi:hypothetical protein
MMQGIGLPLSFHQQCGQIRATLTAGVHAPSGSARVTCWSQQPCVAKECTREVVDNQTMPKQIVPVMSAVNLCGMFTWELICSVLADGRKCVQGTLHVLTWQ